jgi:hypothetical protein
VRNFKRKLPSNRVRGCRCNMRTGMQPMDRAHFPRLVYIERWQPCTVSIHATTCRLAHENLLQDGFWPQQCHCMPTKWVGGAELECSAFCLSSRRPVLLRMHHTQRIAAGLPSVDANIDRCLVIYTCADDATTCLPLGAAGLHLDLEKWQSCELLCGRTGTLPYTDWRP